MHFIFIHDTVQLTLLVHRHNKWVEGEMLDRSWCSEKLATSIRLALCERNYDAYLNLKCASAAKHIVFNSTFYGACARSACCRIELAISICRTRTCTPTCGRTNARQRQMNVYCYDEVHCVQCTQYLSHDETRLSDFGSVDTCTAIMMVFRRWVNRNNSILRSQNACVCVCKCLRRLCVSSRGQLFPGISARAVAGVHGRLTGMTVWIMYYQ